MVLSEATVAGAAGTRLHLRLRVNRIGHHAPGLAASLAGLMDEATVRPYSPASPSACADDSRREAR